MKQYLVALKTIVAAVFVFCTASAEAERLNNLVTELAHADALQSDMAALQFDNRIALEANLQRIKESVQ